MYDVAIGAAYAVLYSMLALFTVLSFIVAFGGTNRMLHKLGCVMIPVAANDEEVSKEMKSADFFMAARSSASAW